MRISNTEMKLVESSIFYEVQTGKNNEVAYFNNVVDFTKYLRSLLKDNPSADLSVRVITDTSYKMMVLELG